jgi:putative membrane protein
MMKKLVCILMAISFFAACNKNDNDNTSLNGTDQEFLQQTSYANRNEISGAEIALAHGSADSVKVFAQMMIISHTTAQTSLDSLAKQFNVGVPETADSAHMAFAQRLQTLSGYAFDTTYMGAQVRDHQLTIAIFQNEISSGSSQQVKNYANTNLPVIQQHLQMAQSILSGLH